MAEKASPGLLRKVDYAKHRNVTPAMVTHWIKGGRLVLDETGKLVDVVKSDAALALTMHPTRGGKPDRQANSGERTKSETTGAVPVPTTSLTAHRATREAFASKEAELDYLERVGELVERARYDKAITDALGPILASLEALSAQYGPVLAAETDVRRVQNILDDAVGKIRQDMADTLQAMIAGGGLTRQ